MTTFKRVEHPDLFEPNITDEVIKDLKKLDTQSDKTEKELIKIRDVLREIHEIKNAEDFKLFKDASKDLETAQAALVKTDEKLAKIQEKVLKSLEKQKKANDALSKNAKDKIKLTQKLNQLNSDSIQDNEELKVQIQEQGKINKELAKDKLGLIDAYDKESKRLNVLRKRYKSLAVQNKENTKEGRALLKNVVDLDKKLKKVDDTVGQNQRSVGKYSKALERLNTTLGKLGIIAAVIKAFEFLGNIVGDNREGALALEIAFSKLSETAKVFVSSLVSSLGGVKDFFSAIGDSLDILDAKALLVFKKIDRSVSILPATISRLDKEIAQLENTITELGKSSVSDAIDKIAEAFEGNAEATSNAIVEQEKFLNLQLRTRIAIEQQEKALAGLAEKRQILRDISDDDTLGFLERAKFVKKAQEAALEFARLDEKLALDKEKLTIQAIKQDLRRSKALSETEIQAIQTGEQLQKILENEAIARKVSDANDEAFTAAFVDRRSKQVEAQAFARDAEEKFRKTARDDFEQELDILEEFTEKRVALNEKIINSDSASLNERRKALEANQKLEQELLNASIDLIVKQGAASIDLRKDLTAQEKEHQKSLLSSTAIQAIVNEQDAQEIFNLIRKLDLGEIEEKRLKETLKIKQDINEVNRESAAIIKAKELEELTNSDEIFNQIERTRREGVIAAEQDAEDKRQLRREDLILQANFETNLLKEGSDERILIAEQLKNDLAAIDRERIKGELDAEKQLQRDREAIQDARFNSANNLFDALETLAGEDEDSLRLIQAARDAVAINEIITNLSREVSAIRQKNAKKENADQLNRAQIFEARSEAAKNLLPIAIRAFEKGGLVEGSEQIIRINEKGPEFVIDHQTTKDLGLDKPNTTMQDFHQMYIPQYAFKDLQAGKMLSENLFSSAEIKQSIDQQTRDFERIAKSNKQDLGAFVNDVGDVIITLDDNNRREEIRFRTSKGRNRA